MSTVEIKDLSVQYQGRGKGVRAVDGVSLTLEEGEILGLTGPSGCGKSTILHVLSGIITDYDGTALIDGVPPDPVQQSIALVPQGLALLPWKTVLQNILLPKTLGKKQCANASHLDEILETLEIASLADRYPNQLSGGQRQRVALARAFVQDPDLLLLDEPFSALDISTAERSHRLLQRLRSSQNITTILVSHNMQEISDLADRVVVMGGAPGRIVTEMEDTEEETIVREIKA
ncbi:MAG: ATP-binding cassette domain-containing protein [Porphyromonas sp.]|nr:ATP-binding cassette domain-containing protein [Porphyromonas sp.]